MESYKVYIFTDTEREKFSMGICADVFELNPLKNKQLLLFDSDVLTNRLVYFERFFDLSAAQKQLDFLSKVPKIVLVKSIRRNNPNWTDLWDLNRVHRVGMIA